MEIQIVLQKAGEKLIYVDFKSSKIENLITPKDEREDLKKAIISKLEKHLENVFNSMDIISNSRKQYEIISKTSNRMPEYESEDVKIEMDNLLTQLEDAINKKKWGLVETTMKTIDLIIEDKKITEAQAAKAASLSIKAVKGISDFFKKGC